MNLLIAKLISSAIQIILFTAIPLIWWMISARRECSFLDWIGMKRIKKPGEKRTLIWMLVAVICFLVCFITMRISLRDIETATSDFSGIGIGAVPAILIYAIFNTALPEEVFFRGFLLKRIKNKFGFVIGNAVQSILFGFMHGVMFFMVVGLLKTVLIILLTGGIGWFMGYMNEKKAEGSIFPSWAIHSLANIFSGVCSAFFS